MTDRAQGCRDWRESLGAYVLEQLPADERAAVDAHIQGCEACRAELRLLRPVAELLPLADPEHLGAAPRPPRSLAYRVASGVAAERIARRRRRLFVGGGLATAAAAATAAVILGVVLAGGGSPSPGSPPGTKRVALNTQHGVEIGAQLTPRPWGSEISLKVRGITPGTRCVVWVRGANGVRVPAGSFLYRYEGGSDAAHLSSSVRPSGARQIGVRAGGHTFTARVA
jgi:predicted anti-sigma-YlaC factor YlaD